ncbi:MAG: adenylate/guanylate cyclase domain-containing protein [Acidimicrobiia bacterium]|nr:adenylate/guanylate cyclase domain-containing protein [Acidimicrobiia bacterium]
MAPDVERKLVAIASVDVAGYSRLMSKDEVGTVARLDDYRDELSTIVDRRRGRIVDTPGDNALVEFPSATDAVESAMEFQDVIAKRNIEVPVESRMEFRIGIHLGEVMVSDDRIYGDGVNVAARLEAIAPVGGISVSKSVKDQVASKVQASFVDLGEQDFKNIHQPIQAFRLDRDGPHATTERAVVSAGVEGFAERIENDEEGTLSSLKAHRTAVDPLVHSHGGRIIGTEKEGIVFEFPSVVEAVKCSVEVQALMAQRNVTVAPDRRLDLLLGIDVGAVAEIDGRLEGEAVRRATRLMRLSEPGGLCLSKAVHDQVSDLDLDLTPDRVGGFWHLDPKANTDEAPYRPSGPGAVVVLPFDRLGNDPDQDYLVDGITEDVTTALTNYGEFRVVPRGSAFAYRDQRKTDREIARELDATYVIRGSVRATASRVRVSVELIDAEADHVMAAERFDREIEDVFDLQDEIARSITLKLAPQLARGELDKSVARGSESLESWDLFQRGRWHYYRTTPEDYENALALLQEAIDKDPENVRAMAFLAFVLYIRAWRGWSGDAGRDFQRATELGEQAVRADPASWRARSSLAFAYAFSGHHDRALREAEMAMPWYPVAVGLASWLAGDLERAIEHQTLAIQTSPGDPDADQWMVGLAFMQYSSGNYEAALIWAEQALVGLPEYIQVFVIMAATLAQLGRLDEARQYIDKFLEGRPGSTAANYRASFRFKNPAYADHIMEGLVMAGLPEA